MADAVIGSLTYELRAGVAKLSGDLNAAAKKFKTLENQIGSSFKAIGAVASAGLGIIGGKAIAGLISQLNQLAQKGNVANSIAGAFERLGGSSSSIEEARVATLGMVSAFDLMKIASEGILRGVPQLNKNLALLTTYGAQLADTLGGDTKGKIEEVTNALARANEKSLLSIGIAIDSDKAYKNYAQSIGIAKQATQRWDDVLSEQQKKLARQNEALDMIRKRSEQLAPVTDGVANAHQALSTAIADAAANLGIGIDESDGLRDSYRDLSEVINSINWKEIGRGVAEVASIFANLGSEVLPVATRQIELFSRGFAYLFGSSNQAQADRLVDKIEEIQEALTAAQVRDEPIAIIQDLERQLEEAKKGFAGLYAEINKPLVSNPIIQTTAAIGEDLPKAVDKAIKKVKSLRDILDDKALDLSTRAIEDALDRAIRGGNRASFLDFISQFKQGIKEGFLNGLGEAYEKAPSSLKEEAQALAETYAELEAKEKYDQLSDVQQKLAKEQRDLMIEAADTFGSAVEDIINGDWANGLGKLAETFSAQLTQAFGEQDFASIGQGIGSIIASATAEGFKGTNAKPGGIAGSIIGGSVGGATGGPIGFAIGAQLGNSIGTLIGKAWKTGLQHAESKARVDFEQWIEEQFESLGNARFFGANGKLGEIFNGNFIGKAFTPLFSQPNWVANMDKWGDKAKGTFLGLGEALKEVRGITEDVGSQIGFLLGENLAGNVDNARLLVQQLGLSFEQVSEALLQSAMKGQISWLQFNSYIRDTSEAFKPGLAAVGAIGDAMQNLIDSAGQGREATKSFKDVAVEALEQGLHTLEELQGFLLERGFDPEVVAALIQAAVQRNINTLDEWANATDSTAGAIVGDMEALSGKLQETWVGMRDNLKALQEQLEEIPEKVNSEVNIKVRTEYDDATREVMDKLGGALPSVPGEGTTDAATLKAATGKGGKIGFAKLSGGVSLGKISGAYKYSGQSVNADVGAAMVIAPTINIDARGAAPGVDQLVRRAVSDFEQKIIANVSSVIAQARMRGGRASDSF